MNLTIDIEDGKILVTEYGKASSEGQLTDPIIERVNEIIALVGCQDDPKD